MSPGERESKAQTRYSLVIGFMHVHDAQFGCSETSDCKLDTLNTVISGEGHVVSVEARSTWPDEETDLDLVGRATLWRCS